MRKMRAGVGLMLVIAAFAGAGCASGATGSAEAAAGVDAAFRDRAIAACQRIAAAKAAWEAFPAGSFNPTQPDASKLATVGTWLESSVLPTWESWQTNLVALGAPASGSAAWDAVVAGVKDTVDLEHAQIAAAQAGDPAAFAATTARLQASHIKFLVDTKTAGVDACGDIVRS